MALDKNAATTEHAGAKNSSHDKIGHREDLKVAARKIRRRNGKIIIREELR